MSWGAGIGSGSGWAQVLVLRRVQERLKHAEQLHIQQETRRRLLRLVDVRQSQLMEPWRRRKELHDEMRVLHEEDRDLDQILPQIRLVSALLLWHLSPTQGNIALSRLSLGPQGNIG